ncbi:MAG: STAS domain-containing protein [Solirubrobacterales bacterium]|nr:STAS domain-containing protein [Solirubrobacterales bacterium]
MGAQDHLSITVTQEDERAVLALDGELDMASAPQLQRAVEDPELAGKGLVVLDLHRLEFIDSTGLRIILAARKLCGERDQELAVTQGSPQVERLLSVTGMSEHLRTVASTD